VLAAMEHDELLRTVNRYLFGKNRFCRGGRRLFLGNGCSFLRTGDPDFFKDFTFVLISFSLE
jgi:hypothetical protein